MSIVHSPLTPAPLPEDTTKRLIEELVENGMEPLEAEQAVKLAGAQSQWRSQKIPIEEAPGPGRWTIGREAGRCRTAPRR